jgi:hypothetical protein
MSTIKNEAGTREAESHETLDHQTPTSDIPRAESVVNGLIETDVDRSLEPVDDCRHERRRSSHFEGWLVAAGAIVASVVLVLLVLADDQPTALIPDANDYPNYGPVVVPPIVGDAKDNPNYGPVVVASASNPGAMKLTGVSGRTATSTLPLGANRALSAVNAREPARRVSPVTAVDFDRLVLVGDSLAEATAPVIRFVTPGKAFVRKYWGGTAPCDWIDDDLEATPTAVVVITFTGNNLTRCMLHGTGVPLIDEPLVEQYRVDVGVLIDHARAAGAWVVLVGQPLRHARFDADLEVEGINAMYREYAATMAHVSYVDAGHLVETTDGHYTDRLPCMQFDTDCAPDGTTVVRGDGVHFCPVVNVVPCPVWSSGAVRFGLGIASAANDPSNLD